MSKNKTHICQAALSGRCAVNINTECGHKKLHKEAAACYVECQGKGTTCKIPTEIEMVVMRLLHGINGLPKKR